MTIGAKIQVLRKAKGLNQADVADQLNISQSAYAKIEADVTKLGIERLQHICEILETDMAEILNNGEGRNIYYSNNKINTVNGFIENYYNNMKEQYESQIATLKEEIAFLREMIKK
jgi:transcriptional regulator with XRE-family HTH domain